MRQRDCRAAAVIALVLWSCSGEGRPAAESSPDVEPFEVAVETTAGRTFDATAAVVGSDFFGDLNPILGRFFETSDTAAAVVLSHEFWEMLGGEARIVGVPLIVDGTRRTVIGVVPPGARESAEVQVFLPR